MGSDNHLLNKDKAVLTTTVPCTLEKIVEETSDSPLVCSDSGIESSKKSSALQSSVSLHSGFSGKGLVSRLNALAVTIPKVVRDAPGPVIGLTGALIGLVGCIYGDPLHPLADATALALFVSGGIVTRTMSIHAKANALLQEGDSWSFSQKKYIEELKKVYHTNNEANLEKLALSDERVSSGISYIASGFLRPLYRLCSAPMQYLKRREDARVSTVLQIADGQFLDACKKMESFSLEQQLDSGYDLVRSYIKQICKPLDSKSIEVKVGLKLVAYARDNSITPEQTKTLVANVARYCQEQPDAGDLEKACISLVILASNHGYEHVRRSLDLAVLSSSEPDQILNPTFLSKKVVKSFLKFNGKAKLYLEV